MKSTLFYHGGPISLKAVILRSPDHRGMDRQYINMNCYPPTTYMLICPFTTTSSWSRIDSRNASSSCEGSKHELTLLVSNNSPWALLPTLCVRLKQNIIINLQNHIVSTFVKHCNNIFSFETILNWYTNGIILNLKHVSQILKYSTEIIRNNSIEITLNHIILLAKYHIYCNATSNVHLVFAGFSERLKNTIETKKYIAYTSQY